MKTTRGSQCLIAAGVLGLAAAAANADIFHRVAVMTGAQEVPANASTAFGCGRFIIDTNANTVTYRIVYSGFVQTASHIHGAANPGVNAGVLHNLPAGNVKVGVWNYAEAQEADILTGRMYVNVHSAAFPGGEIRGQIVSGVALLEAAQEVPPNGSTASGFGYANIDTAANTLSYYVSYGGLSAAETAAHIHGMSIPGVSSGVIHGLPAGSPKTGTWNYSEAQEQQILDGMTYFNIHTTAFPGGEIRGQIITNVNPMDGQQEVPVNASTAAGIAMAALNRSTNQLTMDMRFQGLGTAQTAAHIHGFSLPGVNSGVQFALPNGSPSRATWTTTAANITNALNGLCYNNVHTTGFPGGEIRGQINFPVFGCVPTISSHPAPASVTEPAAATFTCAASGNAAFGTVTYQWARNGTDLTEGAPYTGTATNSLTVDPTSVALSGSVFTCRVTNNCGSVTSNPAALTVNPGGPGCDPDFNGDGNVDQGDVDYLIEVVAGGANPNNRDGDFNGDGNVDQGDVDALVSTVGGAGCP